MGDFFDLYSDEEVCEYFSQDALKDYVRGVLKYPSLKQEEVSRLMDAYKDGDLSAREWIINCNLRLVLRVAYRFRDRIKHMQLLDVVQYGNIGLMRAIETYDASSYAFSTYAWPWIMRNIEVGIASDERTVRIPEHVISKFSTYGDYLEDCESGKIRSLSDDELSERLEVSTGQLEIIKAAFKVNVVTSTNQCFESSEDEYGQLVGVIDDAYDKVEVDLVDRNVYGVMKEVFSPLDYYILYQRVFNEEEVKLEDIAKKLGVTREWIRRIEEKVLSRAKVYMDHGGRKFFGTLQEVRELEGSKFYRRRIAPIDPSKIVQYHYVKDELSDKERRILWELFFGKYEFNDESVVRMLGIDVDSYEILKESLRIKVSKMMADVERYRRFRDIFVKSYGTKMFTLGMSESLELVDYVGLNEKYGSMSYEEFMSRVNMSGIKLSMRDQELLIRYYGVYEVKGLSKEEIEREVNLGINWGKNSKYFSLDGVKRKSVISLLKRRRVNISSEVREELMALFDISERAFMSGKDKGHVFKLFNDVDSKVLKGSENSLVFKIES